MVISPLLVYLGSRLTQYLGLAYVGDSSQWEGSVTTDITCRILTPLFIVYCEESLLTPYSCLH
jgi:hypothetical protein